MNGNKDCGNQEDFTALIEETVIDRERREERKEKKLRKKEA